MFIRYCIYKNQINSGPKILLLVDLCSHKKAAHQSLNKLFELAPP